MDYVWLIYISVAGLVLGSFFNVVGTRIPQGASIIRPRSHCPSCGTTLQAPDLIPVFSYLFLKGRCRYCRTRIPAFYPVMEAVSGILFAAAWLRWGAAWDTAAALILLSLLLIITVSDWTAMLIPDKVLLFFLPIIAVLRWSAAPLDSWWDPLAGAALGFSLLLLIAIVSKGGMGGGDIKLFAVLGFFFGWQQLLPAFFLSVATGALLGGFGLLMGAVKRGVPMPFGPFIAAGSVLTLFFGENLLTWYTGFL
ncbi:prepilin peptidase [Salibacterium halotolerans]|uniref:Prepilin leader peptidase/N-methyltransferase n=1 Tax=Salibacterium halotolerans TaxID=1884432 RepID=A0A1I5STL5_9BACI|nr:A24 family peptidase [Salibacterium halotolerans]SFP73971.1 leader peptidase (prepilin peptidase) / N-methyltransferase [Salibacterium halotolerans]